MDSLKNIMSLEIIVFGVLFGIVSAVVGVNKGRSGFCWFLIGLILGPFGLILSLVVQKDQAAIDNQSISSGAMKKCHYCAELIKIDAIFCRFCEKEVGGMDRGYEVDLHQEFLKLRAIGCNYQIISKDFNERNFSIPEKHKQFKVWSPELLRLLEADIS